MAEFIPFSHPGYTEDEQQQRAGNFLDECVHRRSIREFSKKPVPRQLIETVIRTAGTAPSGANRQPWRFIVVTDSALKQSVRIAAEKEERESYEQRMPEQWLQDLSVLGTDWHKEFLEDAPALIAVFAINYEPEGAGVHKNYYVRESVGIAVGFLLVALHHAGLVALTHTPSPMNFMQDILGRPENEKPFLLIPVGYPAEGTRVPDIQRKTLNEILVWR